MTLADRVFGPGDASAGTATCHVVVAVCPGATWANVAGVDAVMFQPDGPDSDMVTFFSGWLLVLGSDVVTVALSPGMSTDGELIVKLGLTTTGVEPVTPLTVTSMVATPCPFIVTLPPGLTEATLGLLLE